MQQITTIITTVPATDDEGTHRMRQLAVREQDLAALGRVRYTLHNTHVITGQGLVTFVDTLTRESE